jgi:hypothetical protein
MDSSHFAQRVDGIRLWVGKDMLIGDGAIFSGDVILPSARVGSRLQMNGSSFMQKIDGNGLQVGQSLRMYRSVFNGDVILVAAKVDGHISMIESRFASTVDSNTCTIGQHLIMRDAKLKAPMSIAFARIGGAINLAGAVLSSFDLSNAKVTEELRLMDDVSEARWQGTDPNETTLDLRNAHFGVLRGTSAWPDNINLEGFTYGSLGNSASQSASYERDGSIKDWKVWLNKDHHYSPQPYNQLAGVLAAAGRRDHANKILFAGRKRETTVARQQGRWWQWLGLSALRIFIGYGIGRYTFRVLGWIAGSAVLGMLLLYCSTPTAASKGWFWCFGASLDRLLPLVELNKEFGEFFNDPYRVYVHGCVLAFFAGLRLWGWVLGSFLVAALAGLTQKT